MDKLKHLLNHLRQRLLAWHHKETTVADNWERFRKCAVDVLSVDADKVVPEALFGDDLDADSLDLVELVMALEEEFDVTVPEEWAHTHPLRTKTGELL